jgi:fructose-1,6-bisphosphatase
MKAIKKYVEQIEEEIEGAKDYAEKYVGCKAADNIQSATRYKEMANDELKHATYLHEMVTKEINQISKVYTPPQDMYEKWEKAHKKYVEEVAWVKQMLIL